MTAGPSGKVPAHLAWPLRPLTTRANTCLLKVRRPRPPGRGSWRRCVELAPGPVHLDHHLAVVGQQAGQPSTEAAHALYRPHTGPDSRRWAKPGSCRCPGRTALGFVEAVVGTVAWTSAAPVGSQIAAVWVSRWVSTPMTNWTWPSSSRSNPSISRLTCSLTMSVNVTGRRAMPTLPTTPPMERMNPPARSRLQNRQPRWSEAEPR